MYRTGGAQSKTPGIPRKPGKLIGVRSVLETALCGTETAYFVNDARWIEKGMMMTVIDLNGMGSHSDPVAAELAEKRFLWLLLAPVNGIGLYR